MDYSTKDSLLIRFVLLYFVIEAANLFIKLFLDGLPFWGLISKGVLFLALIPALSKVLENDRDIFVLFCMEGIFVFLILVTLVMGYTSYDFIHNVIYVGLIYIPIGCCVGAIKDKGELLRVFYKWSGIPLILLYVTLIGFSDGVYNYSMSCSYALLLWIIVLADHYVHVNRSPFDIVIIVFSLSLIVLKGSRGSLLCFATFLVLCTVRNRSGYNYDKYRLLFLSVPAISLFACLYNTSFFERLYEISRRGGKYGSRILWTLSGRLFYDSARKGIYLNYLDRIRNRFMLGWGLFGGITGDMPKPHNGILELLYYFGIPLGTVIIFIYLINLAKLVRTGDADNNWRLGLVIASVMVSAIYSIEVMLSPFFYMSIAMMIKENSNSNMEKVLL